MGIIILFGFAVYTAIFLVFLRLANKGKRTLVSKLILNSLLILLFVSPLLTLYLRDHTISTEAKSFCKEHDVPVILKPLSNELVSFPSNYQNDLDIGLWRLLFENEGLKIVVDVKKNFMLEDSGNYIFYTAPSGDIQCSAFDAYIDKQDPKFINRPDGKLVNKHSNRCIAVTALKGTEEVVSFKTKTESSLIKSNSLYSAFENTVSLVNTDTDDVYVYIKQFTVRRTFQLFEFSTLFKFGSCESVKYKSGRYALFSELLKTKPAK